MASRRLRLRYTIAAVFLTLVAAVATYNLKYAVVEREAELKRLRAALVEQEQSVELAKADLAYLTRPDWLVMQATPLGMVPGRGARIIDISRVVPAQQLAFAKEPVPAMLPSGADAVLMLKPLNDAIIKAGLKP